ncbi:hypothetical protein NM688_g5215 [Phlebia brevispora]|uniref:Uncharacterized protein n=1 Tax=Phlebia brevispora TaxID=194682 RepID=A0ACC1SZ08_9APHY|nr:hypothetical protein NM688_g5215 [Phlebia brevispora]
MPALPLIEAEYDLIVAGGGTAGCIVAGRLAAAAPDLKILVLEAGPSTKEEPAHIQPARFITHYTPAAKTARFHFSQPSEALGGRALPVIAGSCLGGGSSINCEFGMYTRAAASDYDAWEQTYANPGWGFKDLLPLFNKLETYQVRPNAPNHGSSGPLKVSYGGVYTDIGKQFYQTVGQVDPKRPADNSRDATDFYEVNVFNRWAKWIDEESGRRSDVAHHYIYNQDSKNLHVVAGASVIRVIFEGDRAVGVEYQWNHGVLPEADSDVHTVRASRMVVVSSGTFGSPAILERSGIGAKSLLEKLEILVKVDLEGVGHDYQDHNIVFTPYIASAETLTFDAIMRCEPDAVAEAQEEWLATGKGLIATNGVDCGGKIRPTAQELEEWGAEFKKRWEAEFAPYLDKAPLWIGLGAMLIGDPTVVPPQKYFTIGYFNLYPLARGSVHITSKDTDAPLDFKAGFLENIADVTPLIWGYKYTREIARRMPSFRGEPAPLHPDFPPGSKAGLIAEGVPFTIDYPRVEYTREDDEAIERYVRKLTATCWHSLGTCAMKPRAERGVVDSKLNVYGTKSLKVVDMSICPSNVGANTYSTALVVGEKAAVIIADELGVPGV